MHHCKTCRHFKAVYEFNAQLGNCEYLSVTDNQPCGHSIFGRALNTDEFQSRDNRSQPLCVNRVMDDFGCVYHTPTINFYSNAYVERKKQLEAIPEFKPTNLSEFAAGYGAAIQAVRAYGLERVSANAQSGIPK